MFAHYTLSALHIWKELVPDYLPVCAAKLSSLPGIDSKTPGCEFIFIA